jgi:hypothetical protein
MYGKLRSTAPRTSCGVGGVGAAETSEARTVARKARLLDNRNDLLASITASRIRAELVIGRKLLQEALHIEGGRQLEGCLSYMTPACALKLVKQPRQNMATGRL